MAVKVPGTVAVSEKARVTAKETAAATEVATAVVASGLATALVVQGLAVVTVKVPVVGTALVAATVPVMPDPEAVRASPVPAAVSITRPKQQRSLVIFLPLAEHLAVAVRFTSRARPKPAKHPIPNRRKAATPQAARAPALGISSAAAAAAHRSRPMPPVSGSTKETQAPQIQAELPVADRRKVATSPESAPDPALGTSSAAPVAALR